MTVDWQKETGQNPTTSLPPSQTANFAQVDRFSHIHIYTYHDGIRGTAATDIYKDVIILIKVNASLIVGK